MRALLALALLVSAASTARADVIFSASDATAGAAGPVGLKGTYYHEGSGTTGFSLSKTLALMANSTANGTFVSTSVGYSGNDASSITGFLGNDKASYAGDAAAAYDLSDAILHLTGYYKVTAAGTVSFSMNHDDAAQLKIAGTKVLASDIGTDTANVNFLAPGYYALDLVYANTSYNNGTGGASLGLRANNVTLTSANLTQTVVPEPASIALFGTALVGIGAFRRRATRRPG